MEYCCGCGCQDCKLPGIINTRHACRAVRTVYGTVRVMDGIDGWMEGIQLFDSSDLRS